MAAKEEAKAKAAPAKKGGKDPFVPQTALKDVYYHFCDRKTKLMPLSDVPYVLRACGLIIYGEEEKKIKAEVEKVDGLGKPVSFKTMQDWMEENQKAYVRSYDDAYNALGTLCHEGIIGDKVYNITMPHLRHLVGEVGDKIKPETFDKILKADPLPEAQQHKCTLDEFITWLQK
uniref:Uncharacterized protein n=1 Tax=Strombidinopsis acuminata TaxID=141414 RepID=A0A7S3W3D2_9SPIT|mmetsp:Transcript_67304/g.173296  ORF Transcript_67304/g.173296 Transcript_67304/m.173296 type:complete len:174 (-) Transcript_67304:140-661(-)